jgi:hypothetical protein
MYVCMYVVFQVDMAVLKSEVVRLSFRSMSRRSIWAYMYLFVCMYVCMLIDK